MKSDDDDDWISLPNNNQQNVTAPEHRIQQINGLMQDCSISSAFST